MKKTYILCLFAIVIALCGCGRPQPEAKERKAVSSPNGRLVAKIAVLDLGPEMRLQQVFIVASGTAVKLTGRETGGMIAAIVEQCRDENFDVRWLSDNRLLIEFRQDRPAWANHVPVVQGIRVELKDRSEEPIQPLETTRGK